jgi:hypothetical protein
VTRCCKTARELAAHIEALVGEPCQPAKVARWFEGDQARDVEPFAPGTVTRCECERGGYRIAGLDAVWAELPDVTWREVQEVLQENVWADYLQREAVAA